MVNHALVPCLRLRLSCTQVQQSGCALLGRAKHLHEHHARLQFASVSKMLDRVILPTAWAATLLVMTMQVSSAAMTKDDGAGAALRATSTRLAVVSVKIS